VIAPTTMLFHIDWRTPRELRKNWSVSADGGVGTSAFGKARSVAGVLNAATPIK
jgi:hypothetical protein